MSHSCENILRRGSAPIQFKFDKFKNSEQREKNFQFFNFRFNFPYDAVSILRLKQLRESICQNDYDQ